MYRARVEKDLNDWAAKGLIDGTAVKAMLSEYDARDATFSVSRVLMVLAAVLVSAAILLLVASNWDALPRTARVAGIVVLIWAFYLSGAACLERGARGVGTALLLIATLSFGGAIALIGQMYHLSGDAVSAALVWFAAACVAAVLFRSAVLCILAGCLAWSVFGLLVDREEIVVAGLRTLYAIPFMVLIVIGIVRYTRAGLARHLAYLLFLAWLGWLYTDTDSPWLAFGFFIVGSIAFLAASVPLSPLYPLARETGPAPAFYAFALAVIGLGTLHIDVDGVVANVVLGATTLATALAGVAVGGRMNGAVRFLGYAVFAGETLYLASVTLGSILGTAGFFLISGGVVALIAWLVVRIEKRLSARIEGEVA